MTTNFWRRAGRIATAFVRSFRPELLATAVAAGVAAASCLSRAESLAWEALTAAAGNLGAEMGMFIFVWTLAQPYFRGRLSR